MFYVHSKSGGLRLDPFIIFRPKVEGRFECSYVHLFTCRLFVRLVRCRRFFQLNVVVFDNRPSNKWVYRLNLLLFLICVCFLAWENTVFWGPFHDLLY